VFMSTCVSTRRYNPERHHLPTSAYSCLHLQNYIHPILTPLAMAQAVRCRPLCAEVRFRSRVCPYGLVENVALGQVFHRVLVFRPISIIPPWLHTLWRMKNRPVGGRSSETQSHLIDMNNSLSSFRNITN
jgi:hypothetical protein